MRKIVFGSAAAALSVAAPANAATSAVASASVTLLAPAASITKDQDLSFGTVLINNGGETLTVPADSSVGSGSSMAAKFTVTTGGYVGQQVEVTVPTTIDLSGPNGKKLTVNTSTSPTTLTGSGTVYVGGDLNYGAGQQAGTYSGNFTVTVAYN